MNRELAEFDKQIELTQAGEGGLMVVEGESGALNKLMVRFDQASGYGVQVEGDAFWKMDGSKSITAREKM